MRKPKDQRDWESWIDQCIREARERGEFDNLPDRGRPLDLTPNPYALDRELAFKILQNAGYAPEWIELDKAIRGRLEQARAALARHWAWYSVRLGELEARSDKWAMGERERLRVGWLRATTAFREEVATVNSQIKDLNLKVPSPRFQRAKVDADSEITCLTGRPR